MPDVTLTQHVTITPADQATIWGVGLWAIYRTVDSVEEPDPIGYHAVTPTIVAGTDQEAEEDLSYVFSLNITPGSGQSAGSVVSYRFAPAGTEIDRIDLIWSSDDYTLLAPAAVSGGSGGLSLAVWVGL